GGARLRAADARTALAVSRTGGERASRGLRVWLRALRHGQRRRLPLPCGAEPADAPRLRLAEPRAGRAAGRLRLAPGARWLRRDAAHPRRATRRRRGRARPARALAAGAGAHRLPRPGGAEEADAAPERRVQPRGADAGGGAPAARHRQEDAGAMMPLEPRRAARICAARSTMCGARIHWARLIEPPSCWFNACVKTSNASPSATPARAR